MTFETYLLLPLLICLVSLPLAFWLMTRTLNQATKGLISTTLEQANLLNQAVNLLATKDPLAFQQVLAATGNLKPSQETAPLVTDNYVEVDDDNEYDFDAIRAEYGIK
jgi:hypothetical protein